MKLCLGRLPSHLSHCHRAVAFDLCTATHESFEAFSSAPHPPCTPHDAALPTATAEDDGPWTSRPMARSRRRECRRHNPLPFATDTELSKDRLIDTHSSAAFPLHSPLFLRYLFSKIFNDFFNTLGSAVNSFGNLLGLCHSIFLLVYFLELFIILCKAAYNIPLI